MNTRDDLIEQLKDKEFREAFVSSQIHIGIPYQVRALRGKMSQEELAELAGMKQPRISAIERPGVANLRLDTLKRIAAAFDVALIVRFVPFSELVQWAEGFSPDTFNVPSFDNDADLFKGSAASGYIQPSQGQALSGLIFVRSYDIPRGATQTPSVSQSTTSFPQLAGHQGEPEPGARLAA